MQSIYLLILTCFFNTHLLARESLNTLFIPHDNPHFETEQTENSYLIKKIISPGFENVVEVYDKKGGILKEKYIKEYFKPNVPEPSFDQYNGVFTKIEYYANRNPKSKIVRVGNEEGCLVKCDQHYWYNISGKIIRQKKYVSCLSKIDYSLMEKQNKCDTD